VAEDEVGTEGASVAVPGELRALELDLVRRLEEVGLVDDAVAAHGFDLDLGRRGGGRPLHRPAHGAAQVAGVAPVLLGERHHVVEALEGVVGGADHVVERDAVHEAQAGVELGRDLALVQLDGLVGAAEAGQPVGLLVEVQQAVGEVVGAGDAVVEEVERAVEGGPVEVLGRGVVGPGAVGGDPPVQRLVGGHAPAAAGAEVAVGGDEAGRHHGPAGVDHPGAGGVAGVGAGAEGRDAAVVVDLEPADVRVGEALGHGEQEGVADDELHESTSAR
jgi:hypothetical protein